MEVIGDLVLEAEAGSPSIAEGACNDGPGLSFDAEISSGEG